MQGTAGWLVGCVWSGTQGREHSRTTRLGETGHLEDRSCTDTSARRAVSAARQELAAADCFEHQLCGRCGVHACFTAIYYDITFACHMFRVCVVQVTKDKDAAVRGQDFEKAGQLRDREMELKAKISAIIAGAKETSKAEAESVEGGGPQVSTAACRGSQLLRSGWEGVQQLRMARGAVCTCAVGVHQAAVWGQLVLIGRCDGPCLLTVLWCCVLFVCTGV